MLTTLGILLAAAHVCAVIAAGHALLHKRNAAAALGWIGLIVLLPVLGLVLYLLFGIARVDSRATKLMEKAAQDVMGGHSGMGNGFFSETPRGYVPHEMLDASCRHLARPGRSISGRQLVGGNRVTPLFNGEEAYPVMLDCIDAATTRVFLSSFIFAADRTGKRFMAALAAAAHRGVDVRLLVDGIGSFHLLEPWAALRHEGVQVAQFLPPRLIPPQVFINLRTHRKILVCDGHTAFTGGMNISDHHLASSGRRDRVQDLHFCCEGPIAQQLQAGFLMDWDFVTGCAAHSPLDPHVPFKGETLCRMLMDGPGIRGETIHTLFCSMINASRHSLRIMSPYFLPSQALSSALTSAVQRGVRVDIVLPGYNNHRLVDWAMHHQLPWLEETGVRLFSQPPPFAHTKLMLVDNDYVLMGSANLDPRSLNLNFELVMELFDARLNARLTAFFERTLRCSRPFVPSNPPAPAVRLRNAVCWLFSPYL